MRRFVVKFVTPALLLLAILPVGAQPADAIRQWREANELAIVREYLNLLRLPNVSRNGNDISANALLIRDLLEEVGFDVTLSSSTYPDHASAPLVIARKAATDAVGTLLLYIHYDGQPVNAELWSICGPFEPCLANDGVPVDIDSITGSIDPNWRLYGRSASDDKAPIISLVQANRALAATGQASRWNLLVLLDGQEESGAANFREYLRDHGDELEADLAITLDGPRHPSTLPTMYYGVRGGASLVLKVHTASADLHSGNYGNWAPDPTFLLSRLLTSMKDGSGRVTIAGFYDQVVPLTAAELEALDRIPDIEASLATTFGIASPDQNELRLETKLNLPTLNVLAMDAGGGFAAPSRTAIPAFAQARLAMRLVQGIDPQLQLQKVIDHIRAQGFHVLENREPRADERTQYPLLASVHYSGGRAATRVPLGAQLTNMVARALALDNQQPVQLPTLGGSLPFGDFSEGLGIPTVGVALVNHDNNQHGPDENLKIRNLWEGIEILSRLQTMPRED